MRLVFSSTDMMMKCIHPACGYQYPIHQSIPILINDASSAFCINDFLQNSLTYFSQGHHRQKTNCRIPMNQNALHNFAHVRDLLLHDIPTPLILILGGSIRGIGSEVLLDHPKVRCVETDISFGPHTQIICDAHDIPFANETFDAVVAQAVLEHVADPYRCADEIHRVLKPSGLVYSEIPFMQQVHGGAYDFTRFTLQGHRRLFQKFEPIEYGPLGGPGTALAWAYLHFFDAWTQQPTWRKIVRGFARFTSFWLKYTDAILLNRPGASDAASATFFMGRKSEQTLSDRELVRSYHSASNR